MQAEGFMKSVDVPPKLGALTGVLEFRGYCCSPWVVHRPYRNAVCTRNGCHYMASTEETWEKVRPWLQA